MPIEVEAVFEGGLLRPVRPLPLSDGERVKLEIHKIPGQVHRLVVQIPWPPHWPLDALENGGAYDLDEEPSEHP
jgi:predicted DNA-binding antitoxin AbrB/MazE fold protein